MSVDLKKSASKGNEEMLVSLSQEQQAKIIEVRKLMGQLSDKAFVYCSDSSISRYLRSQNWNVKKASQMFKQSIKWREEYKPEEIRWEIPELKELTMERRTTRQQVQFTGNIGNAISQYVS